MPKLPQLERRAYEFEVRAEENERGHIITGRPIVYGSRTNIGAFDEIIEAGALDTANLNDVRFLVNHNTDMIPLARSRRNNERSTMHFTPDSEGLLLDWVDLDVENNADARALYSAVQRGDISGMSFLFSVDSQEWDNLESEHPLRRILSISSVIELSAVTFPAYGATEINARGAKDALESAQLVLESARAARAAAVETGELELLKAKTLIY